MIEYATADLLGITIITDDNRTRSTTWRNAHAENVKIKRVEFGSGLSLKSKRYATSVNASFIICTDAEPWIYTKALAELAAEYTLACVTISKLAFRIQKIERAMTRLTSAPVDHSRAVDSEYDGFTFTRRERNEMTNNERQNMQATDDAFYDWTHARGLLRRGFTGVNVPPAIPSLATITRIDNTYAPVRRSMMAQRMWTLHHHMKMGRKLGPIALTVVRKYDEA